ncbi:MAG: hypothetical protein KAJ58_00710 [Candidatus Pacebacteria bacterium]|nr:hypothetical protein [Candidatus Paceibacterota bacterium]
MKTKRFINPARGDRLAALKSIGKLEWLNINVPCENCGQNAHPYRIWGSDGLWEDCCYCSHCHFDTWEEKNWVLNQSLANLRK